jgi:hypothetical protein
VASARCAPSAAGLPDLVIRGGQLFDPAAGVMKPVSAILIEGSRIQRVLLAGERVQLPGKGQVIDARGKFLIPGLIDGHVHLVHILREAHITADEILPLFLASGVTTLRGAGDEIVPQRLLFKHAEEHPESCPRLFLSSPVIDRDPPFHRHISWPVTTPAQIPEFVADMVKWGVQTFKIYVGTDRTIGKAVIEEAHRHGKWVTGHLGKYRAQDAVADGIDSLEHIDSVFEFVLPADIPRWPTPEERAKMPAADLATLRRRILEEKARVDLGHPRTTDLVQALVRRRVSVNPTLVVYRNWMLLKDLPEVQQHPDLQWVPERLRKSWLESTQRAPVESETRSLRKRQFAKLLELTGILHRAGVELMVGTDSPVQYCPPGLAIHQELELLVESGLSPAAALTAATRNNARALNQVDQLGSIEAGRLADVVVLDANPLVDIRNARKIFKVIRSGLVCDPVSLKKTVSAR